MENIFDILDNEPEVEFLKVANRMQISAKIDDEMKKKNWSKKDLVKALGKYNTTQVRRWLSGTYNFHCDLLTELEFVFGVKFFTL